MLESSIEIALQSWLVLGQMAPYLLFGFLIAGILSVALSPAWVERHLGRPGLGPVLKASLFGVPLPLCSCSVLPVAASIRRHGASRAATTSFLLSTPQTGVDSIAITYGLLGGVFTVFRVLAALATGLIGGLIVQVFDRTAGSDQSKPPACTEACCDESASGGVLQRAIRYGFVTLPRDIGIALLVGVVITGALTVLVPANQFEAYLGGGIVAILLMMAAGVPIYVCATASVPIAVGFMHLGASPGAALAFLIAGPATNAAAFTTIWKILGRRTALLYLLTVVVSAIACGLVLDALFPNLRTAIAMPGDHEHDAVGWMQHAWAVILLIVLAVSVGLSRWKKDNQPKADSKETGEEPRAGQESLELEVSGMTCGHCAETVRRTLVECEGVDSAEVDLEHGRAVVTGERPDPARLVAAVTEAGFSAKASS